MTTAASVRAKNQAFNIIDPVAVVMGASGNSIGANVAYKLAENSKNPQIHLVSRSQTTADPVIEKLKSLNPEGSYNFHPCDVSLLSSVKDLSAQLSQQLPKVNYLVLAPGILTMQGRTETSEGHDLKMMLHYYSRMALLYGLLPKLDAAAEAGEPARVMSVLDATRSNPSQLNLEDLELKKNYGLKSAADHCISMTDVYLSHLSNLHKNVAFMHAYPGFVKTSLLSNGVMGSVLGFLTKPITMTASDCGEFQFNALARPENQQGTFSIGAKGQEVARPEIPEQVSKKVIAHTNELLGL